MSDVKNEVARDENGNFWTGSTWTGPFHVHACEIQLDAQGRNPRVVQCAEWCPVRIVAEEQGRANDARAEAAEIVRQHEKDEESERERLAKQADEARIDAEVERRIAARDAKASSPTLIPGTIEAPEEEK